MKSAFKCTIKLLLDENVGIGKKFRNLSQLSKKTGISQSTFSLLKQDKINSPDPQILSKLGFEMGVSDYFLGELWAAHRGYIHETPAPFSITIKALRQKYPLEGELDKDFSLQKAIRFLVTECARWYSDFEPEEYLKTCMKKLLEEEGSLEDLQRHYEYPKDFNFVLSLDSPIEYFLELSQELATHSKDSLRDFFICFSSIMSSAQGLNVDHIYSFLKDVTNAHLGKFVVDDINGRLKEALQAAHKAVRLAQKAIGAPMEPEALLAKRISTLSKKGQQEASAMVDYLIYKYDKQDKEDTSE